MNIDTKAYLLLNFAGVDVGTAKQILSQAGSEDALFKLSRSQLCSLLPAEEKKLVRIADLRESEEFRREIELVEKEGIDMVTFFDESYPFLLRQISNPPLLLYAQGEKDLLKRECVAVVGSRRASFYGLNVAKSFSRQLARRGVVVVSGLAYGIDTAAAQGALEEGETIAVLGSGLLNIYPSSNIPLAEKIKKRGLLVSEFPLFASPQRYNFPRRNRIISGLSRGVLVVEAAQHSGALITANFALEEGREVFCVPGPVNSPTSNGTNSLIKEGAKLVENIDDILSEFKWVLPSSQAPKSNSSSLSSAEEKLYSLITSEGTDIDTLCLKSGFDIMELSKILMDLQFKGLIKEQTGKVFVRCV